MYSIKSYIPPTPQRKYIVTLLETEFSLLSNPRGGGGSWGSRQKKKIDKEVTSTVLDVAHRELLQRMNCEHLTKSVARPEKMFHCLKPNMLSLMGTIRAIKVGDWVEVQYEYTPGTCSDGGVGTVSAVHTDEKGNVFCSVGYVLDKRIETGIDRGTPHHRYYDAI